MSLKSKIKSIRRAPSINPASPTAIKQIIETLEVSDGIRGDPRDRKPTIREVMELIGQTGGTSIQQGAEKNAGIGSLITPQTPDSVTVTQKPSGVRISWTWPTYDGHGFTEIYSGNQAELSQANKIGVSAGTEFFDYSPVAGKTYFYFLRHITTPSLGKNKGPFADAVSVYFKEKVGDTVTRMALEVVSALRVVCGDAGGVRLASKDDARSCETLIGIAVTSADLGAEVMVQVNGIVNIEGLGLSDGEAYLGRNGAILNEPAQEGVDVMLGRIASDKLYLTALDAIYLCPEEPDFEPDND